jgi:precorrin-2/cobalt-factor-2 C20-methyltransferase
MTIRTPQRFGRLIGVSLGPGDPGLITRRGWDALQSGARWTYPVKKAGDESYALDIVVRAGLDVPADAVPLVFPMTTHADVLARSWAAAAQQTLDLLRGDGEAGRDVLFLVEGDASTYATFVHLARVVRGLEARIEVETIAGVSSFAASAARTGLPLADSDDTFAVVPANYGVDFIERLLADFDTLVLLKVKPQLDAVIALLERRGMLADACFVEKVGTPDERVITDIKSLKGEKVSYLSLLLIRHPRRDRGELLRGCRARPLSADEQQRVPADA